MDEDEQIDCGLAGWLVKKVEIKKVMKQKKKKQIIVIFRFHLHLTYL